MTAGLTLDVEGDLGAPFLFTTAVFRGDALKASRVLYSVDACEFQVPVLYIASLCVGDSLAVVYPCVHNTLRIAHLAAQNSTATMKGVLRLGLSGEVERGRPHIRH